MIVVTSLLKEYFDVVGTTKKFEIRLKNKKFGNLKKGDYILAFLKDGKGLFKLLEIKEVYVFSNLDDLLDAVPITWIIPKAKNREEVKKKIEEIYKDELKRHKIMAFKVVSRGMGKITENNIRKYTGLFNNRKNFK